MADRPLTRGDSDHAEHDPERIVALLDRDLPPAERADALARVEACAACGALLTDLRSLAAATAALPIPERPHDFTLTHEVAASLRPESIGEPIPSGARLTREMTHSTSGHDTHDRLLIASLIDRSISEPDRVRAEQQMEACSSCRQLHTELLALSAATRTLPVPARPRDFTLTPADAARLRGSVWRRLIAAIGSSRDVFSRPLAIGFTTLGLAGLLVATVPMPFAGGGATSERTLSTVGAPAEDATGGAASNEFTTQASEAPAVPEGSGPAIAASEPSAAPSAAAEAAPRAMPEDVQPDPLFEGGEPNPMAGESDTTRPTQVAPDGGTAPAPSTMFVLAGLLLVIGLGLFGLRWFARRLGAG